VKDKALNTTTIREFVNDPDDKILFNGEPPVRFQEAPDDVLKYLLTNIEQRSRLVAADTKHSHADIIQVEDTKKKIQKELTEKQFLRESPTKYRENDIPSLSEKTRQRVAENTLPLAAIMARSMPFANRIPIAEKIVGQLPDLEERRAAKQEEFKEGERAHVDWQEGLDEAWKKYTERWKVSHRRQAAKHWQHMTAFFPAQLDQMQNSSRAWMSKIRRDEMKGRQAEEQEISLPEISHIREINITNIAIVRKSEPAAKG
jgi:hypothetical protein